VINDGTVIPAPAIGTKWEFVLTPTQPKLIDGSEATEKKFERTYDGTSTFAALDDIPQGVYELTGSKLDGAGGRTPLAFSKTPPYTASVPIAFPVYAGSGGTQPTDESVNFDPR